jgi:hypothetical protein
MNNLQDELQCMEKVFGLLEEALAVKNSFTTVQMSVMIQQVANSHRIRASEIKEEIKKLEAGK